MTEKSGARGVDNRRFIAAVLALSAVSAVLFALFSYFSNPVSGLEKLENWRYASGNTYRSNGFTDKDWISASEAGEIKRPRDDKYIHIKGKIGSGGGYLRLLGTGAAYCITADGTVIYDRLKGGISMSPGEYTDVKLEPSDSPVDLEIIAYTPFSRTVEIYYSPAKPSDSRFEPTVGAALLLVSVLMFAALHIRKKGFKHFVLTDYAPLALFFASAALIIRSFPAYTALLKIEAACLLTAYALALFSYTFKICGWKNNTEIMFALNLLYIIVILFLPYDMFLLTVFHLGVVLQLANAVYLFAVVKKTGADALTPSAAALFSVTWADAFLWYFFAAGWIRNFVVYFVFSMFAGAAYTVGAALIAEKRLKKRSCVEDGEPRQAEDLDIGHTHKNRVESANGAQRLEEVASYGALRYPDYESCPRAGDAVRKKIMETGIGPDGHALRVAEYARIICFAMGMGEKKANLIGDAAVLHDVGKISIGNGILYKTELSDSEFREIKMHTEYGYRILENEDDDFLTVAADVARDHHEHMDGSGYRGLKGNEIPLAARIVTVADTFDALVSFRNYKKTWSFEEAFDYIKENSGAYFDPSVVQGFVLAEEKLRAAYGVYGNQPENRGKSEQERYYGHFGNR